jgi:hypothetical protein
VIVYEQIVDKYGSYDGWKSTKPSDLIVNDENGIKLKINDNKLNDLSGLVIGIGENDKVNKD